jgi:hypothetical protein
LSLFEIVIGLFWHERTIRVGAPKAKKDGLFTNSAAACDSGTCPRMPRVWAPKGSQSLHVSLTRR